MRKEESLKVVKFEYAKVNSVGNRLGLNIGFTQTPTFLEDMEIYVQLLTEASAEIVKEIASHRDRSILTERTN